jgi:hypothetical protein
VGEKKMLLGKQGNISLYYYLSVPLLAFNFFKLQTVAVGNSYANSLLSPVKLKLKR